MRDATLIKTGVAGAVVAAVCCATPVLVLALGALGLSVWLGWADYIALSALVAFLLAAYGFHRRRSSAPGACCATSSNPPGASSPSGKSP